MNRPVSKWPRDERPRERLLAHGAGVLSDAELLAILLRTGTKGRTVVDVARELLVNAGGLEELSAMGAGELALEPGVGEAKGCSLAAAFELAKRVEQCRAERRGKVSSSRQAYELVGPSLKRSKVEEFFALYLGADNRLIASVPLFRGGLHSSPSHPREVVAQALSRNASRVIVAHNHPSGSVKPSRQDIEAMGALNEACRLMDIDLLDHIIVGRDGYYSFADSGLLKEICPSERKGSSRRSGRKGR